MIDDDRLTGWPLVLAWAAMALGGWGALALIVWAIKEML